MNVTTALNKIDIYEFIYLPSRCLLPAARASLMLMIPRLFQKNASHDCWHFAPLLAIVDFSTVLSFIGPIEWRGKENFNKKNSFVFDGSIGANFRRHHTV